MTVSEEIEELIQTMMDRGEYIAPIVVLSPSKMSELKKGSNRYMCNPYHNVAGETSLQFHTGMGPIEVKCDETKRTDYVGINGRTLLDIIAEEALLEN